MDILYIYLADPSRLRIVFWDSVYSLMFLEVSWLMTFFHCRMKDDETIAISVLSNIIRTWLFSFNTTVQLYNPRNFRISKGYVIPYYTGVALPKRSPYTQRVSELCIRLEETGLVRYLSTYYTIKAGLYQASYQEMSYDPVAKATKERPKMISLTLKGHLGGSFYILFAGISLAFVAFLYEIKSRPQDGGRVIRDKIKAKNIRMPF